MATLKKFNLKGEQIGEVSVSDRLAEAEANGQMIKDYIVAMRANARQWSANTKTRSEVSHSTKKPHPQKGTGRARQGMLSAPQYKGGGRAHGPRPKFDQHIRINRQERKAAIRSLIGEKIREGKMIVIESMEMEAPKTKIVFTFLNTMKMSPRVLFLGESHQVKIGEEEFQQVLSLPGNKNGNFAKSIQNLPKVSFSLAQNVNGYNLMLANEIVVTEGSLQELHDWLC